MVLLNYPQTTEKLSALRIMVKAYDAMGMDKLRDDAQRVLELNSRKDAAAPQSPAQAASAPVAATKPGTANAPPQPANS